MEICVGAFAALKAERISSNPASTAFNRSGLLQSHERMGSSWMRAPLAPPRLSEPRKVDADAHAVKTRSSATRPDFKMSAFNARTWRAFTSG